MRLLLSVATLATLLALTGCVAAPQAGPSPAGVRPTATLHPLFEQGEEAGGRRPLGANNSFEPTTARAESEGTVAPAGMAGSEPVAGSQPLTGNDDVTVAVPVSATPQAEEMPAPTPGAENTPASGAVTPAESGIAEPATGSGGSTGIAPSAPEPNRFYIFRDSVHSDWSLQNSDAMSYRLVEGTLPYSGTAALAMTPTADFGTLFFTVREGASQAYPRRQVERVVFWIYSPEFALNLDSLAVTIVGSNAYPHWVKGDNSVDNEIWPIFSETRFEFLGFNHPIPAATWAEVEIWLDDLIYDPTYEWVTGFYIKNDEGYYDTVFIDELHLVMVED
jgi:hypothetical protein